MTYTVSLMIMQVLVSSVNWALNLKPSWVKKSTDLVRLFTGRFTKIDEIMWLV